MDLLEPDRWRTFIEKTEELFVCGYKLSIPLQLKAVDELDNKLVVWKNTLPVSAKSRHPKDSDTDVKKKDGRVGDNTPTDAGNIPVDGGKRVDSSDLDEKTDKDSISNRLIKDKTGVVKTTTNVKRGRPRKRRRQRTLHMNADEGLLSETVAEPETVEYMSHSDDDIESARTEDPLEKSVKNSAVKNVHIQDVRDCDRRRSKRIKSRRMNEMESDDDGGREKNSILKRTAEYETVVKLEVTDNDSWNNNRISSPEDQKPVTRGKRGRPRKLQSLPDNLFEGLNLTHKCSKCSKSYGTSEVLKCHMEVHKDDLPLTCLTCSKTYNSRGGFDNHIRTHDPDNQIQCPHCEFRYPNYTVMNRHVLMKHAAINSRPFLCDLCGKGFLQPSTLKVHMCTHDVEKNFACDQCKFRTHTKNILAVHKKNIHSEKEYYCCDLCDVRVKYKGSLIEHRRRHFGERPHQCPVCSSKFTSRSQLAQHKKIHREKTFVCDQCKKKFIDRHKLARHMTIHTGEKKYSCGFCSYQCNVRGNIRKHWLFVHKIDHDRRMQRVKLINTNGIDEEKMLKSSSDVMKRPDNDVAIAPDSNQLETQENDGNQQITEACLKSIAEKNQEENNFIKVQTDYSNRAIILPEITSDGGSFQGTCPVLSVSTDLPSVLSETELCINGVADVDQHAITETVIDDGKVLELPVASNSLSVITQDSIYPGDLGLETKVEMAEDGTQYVYVYFPVDQIPSQSAVPTASTEEYVVTVEETETQQASLGLNNMI
ncbi:hypothetical protein LSH36_799g00033 [Paralvinella palmiformis]|uniref:C2H2-type domain-containing protein n=1 Tax=Paralvinella palmiformis TaxID=53620 RepID=A0AAD9IZT0_9ANNE|nr:hypothetical protein LSH36_799g00033 [Paralvinella palmiformis]